MLVSGVEQSASVIPVHTSTLFKILSPYRSLQSVEYSSQCYSVGPDELRTLYIEVYICQSLWSNLSLPSSYLVTIRLFSTSVTIL